METTFFFFSRKQKINNLFEPLCDSFFLFHLSQPFGAPVSALSFIDINSHYSFYVHWNGSIWVCISYSNHHFFMNIPRLKMAIRNFWSAEKSLPKLLGMIKRNAFFFYLILSEVQEIEKKNAERSEKEIREIWNRFLAYISRVWDGFCVLRHTVFVCNFEIVSHCKSNPIPLKAKKIILDAISLFYLWSNDVIDACVWNYHHRKAGIADLWLLNQQWASWALSFWS